MKRLLGVPFLAVALLLAAGAGGPPGRAAGVAAAGGDWPMYGHDAQRTSFSPDETTISAANVGDLVARWQADIGSNGVAPSGAPSVAGGRVYVASSRSAGANLYAFDAASGAVAWRADIGHKEVPCFNIGVGATPAIANGLLVTGGGDSAYYGIDAATGAQRWRRPLDAGPSGFPWASPVFGNGLVYVGVASRCDDPSVRGAVWALNPANGTVSAAHYFVPAGQAGAGIWNSPALTADSQTLVVATGEDYGGYNGAYNRALVTLDPTNLAVRQADKQGAIGRDLDYGSTPVIFHDAQGRALVGANHKNGIFYAYRLDNLPAGPLWSRATGTQVGMMPAYDPNIGAGGTLYIVGSNHQLFAVDPATGHDRWGPVTIGTVHGNMALANGLLFLNAGSGGLQVLDAASGKLLRTLQPAHAGAANSGLAVAHGFLYWLSGSYLNAWSLPAQPVPPSAPAFADPAFARLWTQTDSLVASHAANRSWFWGPAPISRGLQEAYKEGPGGQHLVQYFDKSRMEINHPNADPASPFYVTNGLLAEELISGRMQVGDTTYQTRSPAAIPIAGDLTDPTAPTYATFQAVSNTALGDHRAPDRTGSLATATINRQGQVGSDASKGQIAGVQFVHYESATGHNVPRVFWDFLNAQGPTVSGGLTVTAPLWTPWFYGSGLPISEPYWATVQVAGQPLPVLIQAYERRVLTYNPANSAPFQVEMGNVGQHYLTWRYGPNGP